MKMRIAIALVIGLTLTGTASALFTTAPTADSGDDIAPSRLPSSPSASSPTVSSPPPPLPPMRAAAAPVPKAETVHSGNPLWGIPLREFKAAVARPLFAPTRRPPPPPQAAPVSRAAPPPPPTPEPEKPPLSLVGTVAIGASNGIGLFVDQGTKTLVRLKTGDNHQGWLLRNVQRREVMLEKGREKVVLTLPPPELKKSAGAAGPAAPVVAVPAGSAQTGAPQPVGHNAAIPPSGGAPQAGAVSQAVPPSADGATPFAGMIQLLTNRQAR